MGAEDLANAIIEQTAIDYMNKLRKLNRHPDSKKTKIEIEEIELFFRSSWYKSLTQIDPEYLIKRMKKEIKK